MKKQIVSESTDKDLQNFMSDFTGFCLKMINESGLQHAHHVGILLLAATFANDIAAVECVLDAQLSAVGDFGCTAALIASGMGHLEITRLLFERCPSWFEKGELYKTILTYPIELAAMRNQRNVVDFLLPHTSLSVLNNLGGTNIMGTKPPLLIGLVKCDCPDILKVVLERKPDLDIRSSENLTALAHACSDGNFECARLLVEAGAKVNFSTKLVRPNESSSDPVSMLVEKMLGAASIELSPLHYASAAGDPRLVYLLLQAGAEVNMRQSMLGTPLMLASRAAPINTDRLAPVQDYPSVVRLLLINKADVDARHPFSNETALFGACLNNQDDIIKQLLLAGANPDAQNNRGENNSATLSKMGILTANKTGPSQKLAEKRQHIKNKAENILRKQLIAALSSGTYQPAHAGQRGLLPKLEAGAAAIATQSQTIKAKKKKKNKNNNKKKRAVPSLKQPQSEVSAALQQHKDEADVQVEAGAGARLLALPVSQLNSSQQETLMPVIKEASSSLQLSSDTIGVEAEATVKKASDDNQGNNNVAIKPESKLVMAVGVSKIPRSIFKPDIPTGEAYQKFPLHIEGVRYVHYFVHLIPNVLNAMFGSEHASELNKVWAAIKMERLLLPKSKGKAGVKCLSLQETGQLKSGFFKKATHKVKPNREDVRVYLESKLATEEGKNEFHLDLIGPDFSAHK